jgi:alkaline phosphatase
MQARTPWHWLLRASVLGCAVLASSCSSRSKAAGDVTPEPPQPVEPALRFEVQARGGQANTVLPEVVVSARDAFGQPAPAPVMVHIALVPPTQGARLSGTLSVPTAGGFARFADLAIDRGGTFRVAVTADGYVPAVGDSFLLQTAPLHLILMIADGWGYKHIEAQTRYSGQAPFYTSYASYPMATYDVTTLALNKGVGYNAARTWSNFDHTMLAATDSAAAATAMYAGDKTYNGRLGTSVARARLLALSELADGQGLAIGAVTTVPLPHATPGAWLAHNEWRGNHYAIADEMLWGDPNTTGTIAVDARYGGALGTSALRAAVILAAGHPGWCAEEYMRHSMRDKLALESGTTGAWTFVERIRGQADGGARLLAAANSNAVRRLCGLFGGGGGHLEFRRADGSGASRENPTLPEMTRAALIVLQRRREGMTLMIESGAVDFAGHFNQLDACIGELLDFELAVRAVVDWVDQPGDQVTWNNTLLIITGDHECGYLTAGRRVFPNVPFTEVSARTLALERLVVSTGRRASWEDTNANGEIDPGEAVYWVWHSGGHTNSLIPLYVRGVGEARFATRAVGNDPVRGQYIDNTSVFHVMRDVLLAPR